MDNANPRLLTRRDALAAGVAAAGTLALGRFAAAADTPDSSAFGPFRMGLQSYSLRHFKLHETLEKTKELGLDYLEAYPAHIPADLAKAEAMRKHTQEHGV